MLPSCGSRVYLPPDMSYLSDCVVCCSGLARELRVRNFPTIKSLNSILEGWTAFENWIIGRPMVQEFNVPSHAFNRRGSPHRKIQSTAMPRRIITLDSYSAWRLPLRFFVFRFCCRSGWNIRLKIWSRLPQSISCPSFMGCGYALVGLEWVCSCWLGEKSWV